MRKIIKVLFVILVIQSCKTTKLQFSKKCFESKKVEAILIKDFSLKKSFIEKFEFKPYLFIDSICSGMFIVTCFNKDSNNTKTIFPILKSYYTIFIYSADNEQLNIKNFEEFKNQMRDTFTNDEFNKISKRFFAGILKESEI
jgi:hypothetical protein